MSVKKQDDVAIALPPANWTDLNDVPAQFRKLNGARLDLEQVNWIDVKAHEYGFWIEDEQGAGKHFVKDFARAREEFKDSRGAWGNVWMDAKLAKGYAEQAKRDSEVN